MMRQLFFLCACTILLVSEIHSARILVLYPFASKSHKIFANPILEALAIKGHEIVMVSPYKTPITHPRFKDIIVNTSFEEFAKEDPETGAGLLPDIFESKKKGSSSMFPTMWLGILEKITKTTMEDPMITKILEEKWDLVIMNSFVNELALGIVHKINKPVILLSAGGLFPWHEKLFGNPSQLLYTPITLTDFGGQGTLLNKIAAEFMFGMLELHYNFKYLPTLRKFNVPYFGEDLPDFHDILRKSASLILTNTHYSISSPLPYMPSIVEAGGAHCQPSKPLPKDLEDFVDASGDKGFIFFSMGSVIQAKNMPEQYRKEFINAFAKLPYKVLWKWETEHMDDLPSNVKLIKWAPQQDILGHTKLRLFITHGGGMSTMEAAYHGVPILGFPMFGDQPMNIQKAENKGFALGMDILDLTAEKLVKNVQKVIETESYQKNAKTLSAVFRDQNPAPVEVATYWVEYVMRHNGAKHLRSVAADMPLYQYYLLDVFAFLGFVIVLSGVLIVLSFILLYKCIRRVVCGKACANQDTKKKTQ